MQMRESEFFISEKKETLGTVREELIMHWLARFICRNDGGLLRCHLWIK
jgi:hypothetical protein